ncbi:thiolase C-terminal domain-containing protein [Cryptosporangium aurantiacum]|uniref:Acetyl-CoA acetyltransferase n=1 Tax=Cryptosporangium aurantiacum TaxID=134849 RepID=A0A1M7RJW2_9ACTN|nr:OB-fold domain-containing protein [Cryptosporangium aurantiacum]SHN46597.1 Acetyl-CoA acetyltransferase [Cryptosporangium aurantiacum]
MPLPLVTPENEFYWTAGADGVLRMRHCRSCDALIHPPRPACHRCRSSALDTVELSGRGQIVGVTVNHQQWGIDPPEPYTLAAVALDDDYRVRITGRVHGDGAVIGAPVTVEFAQAKDVWIPQFRVAGEPSDLPPLEEDPAVVRSTARPPVSADRYEEKSAVTGIGMSRIGRRLMADPLALTVEACRAAVEDAGLTFDDIDGLATYPGGTVPGGFSEGGLTLVEETLRLRPVWYNGGGEVPGPGGSVVAAMLAVAAGLCRHVLVYRTVWQATHTELLRSGRLRFGGGGRVGPPMDFMLPVGATSAAHPLAITASHYMHRYGVERETLGWIALNQRANAARNPTAIYRTPMTMDDYLGARLVTTPFGLYDCDVPCDASIAVVISRADVAADLRQPPVRFAAVGTQITERVAWDQSTLTHEPQVLGSAAHLWSRTDLRPADVDVAELYDGFTFNCLSWLEGLGFCGIGEAAGFVEGGKRIALDGELPLNTHGGQLSHGRTHGFGLLHEAVTQLRGHGGDRQVPGAEVAVVSSGGLTPSSCMLLVKER